MLRYNKKNTETSALDGSEWLASRLGRFTSGARATVPIGQGPQCWSGCFRDEKVSADPTTLLKVSVVVVVVVVVGSSSSGSSSSISSSSNSSSSGSSMKSRGSIMDFYFHNISFLSPC